MRIMKASIAYLKVSDKKVNRCIYRNDNTMCIVDRDYLAPYHSIVVLNNQEEKDHPIDMHNIEEPESIELMKTIQKCISYLKNINDVERIYVACLNEYGHVHFHLIPKKYGNKGGFDFLGKLEQTRKNWDDLKPIEKEMRIDAIHKMINDIGRHCEECPKGCPEKNS